jgi:hypothetical protein
MKRAENTVRMTVIASTTYLTILDVFDDSVRRDVSTAQRAGYYSKLTAFGGELEGVAQVDADELFREGRDRGNEEDDDGDAARREERGEH